MKHGTNRGAYYIELEHGEDPELKPVQLGERLLEVGETVDCLGNPASKRCSFKLVDDWQLKFEGWWGQYLLFGAVKPDGSVKPQQLNLFQESPRRMYFAFGYIDENCLLVHSGPCTAYDLRYDV